MEKKDLLRKIPQVNSLLENEEVKELEKEYGHELVVEAIRKVSDDLRRQILYCNENGENSEIPDAGLDAASGILEQIEKIPTFAEDYLEGLTKPDMCRVINGTGTILHTNLGRALLNADHVKKITDLLTHYSNLEYNLMTQSRGSRYDHFEKLLCRITGAEAAMAVNNNASAVMLILSTMGKGKEIIVSRGEQVEIGGKFRIPDVMEISGASLVEIGTTNKTHAFDYEKAINEETAALLKVHTSNYKIVGFTESVDLATLKEIAVKHDIPLIEDLGSGVLIDLEKYGLIHEPTVQESVRAGADVVCFSGDKLLGGPQAGIIVGKKKYIDEIKKNQLTRAFRIDKFTAAALEVTLLEYLDEKKAVKNIPVLRMMTQNLETIEKRAEKIADGLNRNGCVEANIMPLEAQIGGGSLPLLTIPSFGVAIISGNTSAASLERKMHEAVIPIIPRVFKDQVVLDAITIQDDEIEIIIEEICG